MVKNENEETAFILACENGKLKWVNIYFYDYQKGSFAQSLHKNIHSHHLISWVLRFQYTPGFPGWGWGLGLGVRGGGGGGGLGLGGMYALSSESDLLVIQVLYKQLRFIS